MCGVAGLFSVGRPVDADMVAAVLRMLDRQVHRGPDDWGILIPSQAQDDPAVRSLLEPRGWEHVRTYPGSSLAPAAVLGSRRLSILDLSAAGRMPMVSRDGCVAVTYNGEIYNFKDIRNELRGYGHTFTSNTDTEVLLHGYQQWGDDLPTHLRGMFAFAVLDSRRSGDPRLFLARDRFGIKPLYWTRHKGVFQFASEVRAIQAAGLIENEPEPRALHGFLMYGSVPTPWTTVRGVQSLPAAESLAIDQRSYSFPRPSRYWFPPASQPKPLPADLAAHTRELMEASVREQLISDVPIGVFLSGGMDSSAIAALAGRELRRPLTTLCVTFDEQAYSEATYARTVADQYKTNHIEVRVRADDFINELPHFFDSLDQPTADGVNSYFVTKAAKAAGLKVVLSGVGGDELFWGYPGFRSYPRLRMAARVPLVPALVKWVGRALRVLGQSRFEKLEFLAEHPVLGPYLTIRGIFPPRRAAQVLGSGRMPLWHSEPSTTTVHGASEFGRLEIANYLQNQLLRDTDVFGMRHSVEVRVPFLDERLAEWLLQLPASALEADGQNKPLLAAAIGPDYPKGFLNRPKMGFTFPMDGWIRTAWPAIGEAAVPASSLVSHEQLEAVASEHRRGRLHWSRPWALAVLRAAESRQVAPRLPDCAPKRMLLVLPQVYGATGGIPIYNQGLLRAITEAFPKAEIHVVSVNDGAIAQSAVVAGNVHFSGGGPRSSRLFRWRLMSRATKAALRARPDVVITGHINILPFTRLVSGAFGVPNFLVAHGVEVWAPKPRLRRLVQQTDRILAVSNYTAERMREWGASSDRIRILPNMVDGDVFRPVHVGERGKTRTLLTVARLDSSERYKGIDRVIEALRFAAQQRSIRYVVAGTGNDLPRLQALAQACGVADLVEFRGFVPMDDLPELYTAADVFIMPSKKEGFGIVFVEALACGTPVIAGNQDGSADALMNGEWGRLVDPDDADQILAAILDPDLRAPDRNTLLGTYGFEPFRARVGELLYV